MPTPLRSRASQGELFSPPAKLPQLPPETHQKVVRLLARILNEHLLRRPPARTESLGRIGGCRETRFSAARYSFLNRRSCSTVPVM